MVRSSIAMLAGLGAIALLLAAALRGGGRDGRPVASELAGAGQPRPAAPGGIVAPAGIGAELPNAERSDPPPAPSGERRPVVSPGPAGTESPPRPPFRGRVVDRTTGEAVPALTLRAVPAQPSAHGAADRPVRSGPIEPPFRPSRPKLGDPIPVGDDGRFDAGAPLAYSTVCVEAVDALEGTRVGRVKIAELERDADGDVVRLAVGPTLRFSPSGPIAFDPAAWEARMVETAHGGAERMGSWREIHPADPPWIRYDDPWAPLARDSRYRVELREKSGVHTGASATFEGARATSDGALVGVHPNVLTIQVRATLALAVGRVVDRAGEPVRGAHLKLLPLDDGTRDALARPTSEGVAEGDGTFALAASRGPAVLLARARLDDGPVARRLVLDRDSVDVGDVVVEPRERSGAIGGWLRSTAGRSIGASTLVRVRPLDGGPETFVASHPVLGSFHGLQEPRRGPKGASVRFEVRDPPTCGVELSVVARDGSRWLPESIVVVAPPREPILFERQDDGGFASYAFDVSLGVDGPGDGPGDAFEAWIQVEGQAPILASAAKPTAVSLIRDLPLADWSGAFELPADTAFTWTVSAPGSRTVSGDESAFTGVRGHKVFVADPTSAEGVLLQPIETRVAHVALRPGFSARLRFRDLGGGYGTRDEDGRMHALTAAHVDGVRVLADGRVVATSTGGEARIDLDAEPERLAFDVEGWTVVETGAYRRGRLTRAARDVAIWFVRD